MIILRFIRAVLGRIIIFFDWLSRPKKAVRSDGELAQLAKDTTHLSIYQFYTCPFCVKTRRALHRLNLPIELRDARPEGEHRSALLEGGGRVRTGHPTSYFVRLNMRFSSWNFPSPTQYGGRS